MNLEGLYVITDIGLTPYEDVCNLVIEAVDGGARIVQLRDKFSSDEEIEDIALGLKKVCHDRGAILIIDDRIELAQKIGADGIHIGADDISLQEARERFDGIIGVSCYGDVKSAKNAQEAGASYVAFGSFYYSETKPHANLVDKDVITQAKKELAIPVCAIGGLSVENAQPLVDRGADMLAVVGDIWRSEDIKERAKEYTQLMNM